MPIDDEPESCDSYEDDDSEDREDVSTIVERLRETLTHDMATKAYECRHGTVPDGNEDMEMFMDELISEAYNAGYDDWSDEFLYYD